MARTAAKVAVAAGVVVGSVVALTPAAHAANDSEVVQAPFGPLHSFVGVDDVWTSINGMWCKSYLGEAVAVPVIEGNAGTSTTAQVFVNGAQSAVVQIIQGQDLGQGISGLPLVGATGGTTARITALACVGATENLTAIEVTVNNSAFASVAGLEGTVDASVTSG